MIKLFTFNQSSTLQIACTAKTFGRHICICIAKCLVVMLYTDHLAYLLDCLVFFMRQWLVRTLAL